MPEDALVVAGHDHVVQFYESDAVLAGAVGAFVGDGLASGDVVVVIATPSHVHDLLELLLAAGVDVDGATQARSLVVLDAAATLTRITSGGRVDADAFDDLVGSAIREGLRRGRVRAFGEMVALLWDDGLVTEALELETLWNRLAADVPFSLLCAYPRSSVSGLGQDDARRAVCDAHAGVVALGPARTSAQLLSERSPQDSSAFPCTAHAATAARRFVTDRLVAWGWPAPTDDIALVVTELATNAIRHAQSPFAITLRVHHGTAHVEVVDDSTAVPAPRAAPPTALSGRGLRIVDEVADRWGVEVGRRGKVVWAELRG